MFSESEMEIVNQLKLEGFAEELILKALKYSQDKTTDSLKQYILELQNAREEIKRREAQRAVEDLKEKYSKNDQAEEIERQKLQKIRDEEYLNLLREQIKAEREEKLAQTNQTERAVKKKTNEPDNLEQERKCKIKVRFTEGGSSIYTFDKNDSIEKLFAELEKHYGNSKFQLYDVNFVVVKNNGKSFYECGYYPSNTINAKKA
ncbi:hypothetical protein EDEG_00686 [Edhazardia aedis USNM 41457]|uniref:UBX domain-containing protein n=1 Tax=Edhazardia aedis (strain USNM 41457) TaxID=1003232 RepID=J9DBW9_EDHAE|nr:hypothetical protein EDEG_00686 [Edhazardia aedis USNM 41457]|eukprot:EJW05221.1 hypothetical protein EDEG_00686 [Edhazardia aedis USNM 41457]